MGHSQSQPSKSPPLGCLFQNLDFQGELRPKRLMDYSSTVWPQCRLYNRSQRPENRTLSYNTLQDLDNFCHHHDKWLEIPHVQDFFALCSRPSLCESCSTSQILLPRSGPHPPHTKSPDLYSEFSSSSLELSDHSPHPMAHSPFAAAPDPIHNLHFMPHLPSLQTPLPACAEGKIWDLSPTLYPEGPKALPDLHKTPPYTPSWKT